MIRYNDLAKVSAVETFENELVVSKWVKFSFISVPDEVPGTGNPWKSPALEIPSAIHCRTSRSASPTPFVEALTASGVRVMFLDRVQPGLTDLNVAAYQEAQADAVASVGLVSFADSAIASGNFNFLEGDQAFGDQST